MKRHYLKRGGTVACSYSVIEGGKNYADNIKFGGSRGHGFAAEGANHLKDVVLGKEAKLVGDNHVPNGPDRIVDGVEIQSKYCKTGSRCIEECFKDNRFRYFNKSGKPMRIEVPSDKYEAAIKAMENRIRKGQVPGVSDPKAAKRIVQKGHFTYDQARNIAKLGTIESLTYDAKNGIKLAGKSGSISSVISFGMAIWSGKGYKTALKEAGLSFLKTGATTLASSVIAAQAGRTGIEQGLRGTTDWAAKKMGHKAASSITKGLSGKALHGAAATSYVSKVLRGNAVTGAATTLVLSAPDIARLFRGRISAAQAFKNVATVGAGVAGGSTGGMVWAAMGAPLGPIGFLAVGLIGSLVVGKVGKAALDGLIEDDAKRMIAILKQVFSRLAREYLLNKREARNIVEILRKKLTPKTLQEMFASEDRERFAKKLLHPLIRKQAKNRISIPIL